MRDGTTCCTGIAATTRATALRPTVVWAVYGNTGPDDVQAFIEGTAAEAMEGDCTAEDFLLMQLRLRKGLSLAEYGRWGGSFTSSQKQFIRQCVAHGYAEFDEGKTLRLTPAGMVVQNSILTELM